MKRKIMFLLFVFSVFILNGQEIKLNSAVVASAGSNPELSTVNISKWRLGEVHLIVLQRDELNELPEINWNVNLYPNPFRQFLNLDFQTDEILEFTIQVTDIAGKKQWSSEEKTILPNQEISLDLDNLAPATYFVTITQKNKKVQRVIKVQKH
ncbi:MAG: T9SS type A sorting domain-containing protein [Bacteroidetes bacterium]|nr:T9SS type A sorting domain-containing protein [Bacteroidota bacterium]